MNLTALDHYPQKNVQTRYCNLFTSHMPSKIKPTLKASMFSPFQIFNSFKYIMYTTSHPYKIKYANPETILKAKIGKIKSIWILRKHIFGIRKQREDRDVSKNCKTSEFIQCGLSMTFWSIHTLFTGKGYGSTKTKNVWIN